jgi:hypothetical protein
LLAGVTGGEALAGQFPTTHGEGRRRHQPMWQDRKRLSTGLTDSPSYPDRSVPVIVALPEPASMADDGMPEAKRTPPREKTQGNYPRLGIVFRLSYCDKENHGWREGPPRPSLPSFDPLARAFTLPAESAQTKKEYSFASASATRRSRRLAGLNPLHDHNRDSLAGTTRSGRLFPDAPNLPVKSV